MTRVACIAVAVLAAFVPVFGASFEGTAKSVAVAGPEVFSTDDAGPAGAEAMSITSSWLVPNWASVQQMKAQKPVPRQDAVKYIPPPSRAGNPPVLERFDGLGKTPYDAPDPAIAVGLSEVVQVVNSAWAIYDKAGRKQFASPLASLFRRVEPPPDIYQAQVFYDQAGQRWVISALGRNPGAVADRPVWLLAVSQQAAALGRWWVWKLDAAHNGDVSTSTIPDDQALGYNDKLVVMSANMFAAGTLNDYNYAKVRILDKQELYHGRLPGYTDYWGLRDENGRTSSSVRPMRSPAGAEDFYLANVAPDSGSTLTLWRLGGPAGNAALKRLPTLKIHRYDAPPNASQPGTSVLLETGPVRLQSLHFINRRLFCTFHEIYPWTGLASAGIRFLVIGAPAPVAGRNAGIETPPSSIVVDQTLGNGLTNFFNPSVTCDGRGNVYFAFNFSDANLYPGVAYAGWKKDGTLAQPVILESGMSSSGTVNPAPFGRVTSIALDPNADNVAWVTGANSRTAEAWGTAIGALSFDPLRFRAKPLADGSATPVTSDATFRFGQTQPHWNAVALRTSGNWQLETWDANFLTLRARSGHDLPIVLTEVCVADGNHSPLDTMGVKVTNLGNIPGTLQFSQAGTGTTLQADAVSQSFSWKADDVVKVFDYHAVPGMDTCFALSVLDGNTDLGMAIFESKNTQYYANRYQAVAMADVNGPGQGEYLTFKPMLDDIYAVVTWANNAEASNFNFSTACQVRGDPFPPQKPDRFSISAAEGGTMGAQASIIYSLPARASISLRVYDIQGRAIRTLAVQTHEQGTYKVTWDGRNTAGRAVAAGTYLVRLESRQFNGEQKLVKVQ